MLRAKDKVVGFVENCSDPNDLQAWCAACEAVFLDEDGMTERFRSFNDMALVCDICYTEFKERHSLLEEAKE